MAALALFFAAMATPAQSLTVSPLVVDMSALGPEARATIRVLNDGKTAIPVEIEVFRLDLSIDGEATRTPAGDDFIVFPPQAVVKPGATQIFRLQWAGEPGLEKSQSYVIAVTQVPVKLAAASSGVQVLLSFSVIVNVAPKVGRPQVEAVSTDVRVEGKAIRPVVLMRNTGNRHAYLSDMALTLTSSSWSRTISAGEMKQLVGIGLIPAGAERRFVLPIEVPEGASAFSAHLAKGPATGP
jgi:P pilus assembly chaperone PapD